MGVGPDWLTEKDMLHDVAQSIFRYHRPELLETMERMGSVREAVEDLSHRLIDICPNSSELRKIVDPGGLLDRVSMMAIASLARHEPKDSNGPRNDISHKQPLTCSCGDAKAPGFNHKAVGTGPCLPRQGR